MLKQKYIFLFILSIGFLCGNFSNAQNNEEFDLNINTRNYNQQHIKLNLNFNFEEGKVWGTDEFTFSPLINDFDKLVLHCKSTRVYSVKLDDEDLDFSQDENYLYVNFKDRLSKDDKFTISIDYESHPVHGLFFFYPTKDIFEIPYQIWSQGQGTNNRNWYPAYDLPDDKLTAEMIATIPDNMIAVSNGKLVTIDDNPDTTKTFHWKMDKPFSNYLTTLIIGEFETIREKVRGSILEYNIPENQLGKFDYTYGRTPQMMEFFSDYIADYPYKRYAQTAVQDFLHGGMENVTATTLNSRIYHDYHAIPNYSPDALIAHEMAHMWWGDYVTCQTWEHIWLNEGFATYFTDLWFEDEFGENEFRYRRYQNNNDYFDMLKEQPLNKYKNSEFGIPLETDGRKAYDKGSAVLNALRFELGDEVFKKGIKHYVELHKNQNVVTEEFREAMEEVSGKNLETFFKQWIYAAGFPVFDVKYEYDNSNKQLKLTVTQTQEMLPTVQLFDVPILIEITAGNYVHQEKIRIDKVSNTFTFDCPEKPQLVRFNKYFWTLCQVNFPKKLDELVYQLNYDDDVTGRIMAVNNLADFGENSVQPLKRSVLRDTYYGVRIAAVNSLKEIGGDKVYDALILAAEDIDARVRESAIYALSNYSNEKLDHYFYSKSRTETNDYVLAAIAYAIGKTDTSDLAFDYLRKNLGTDSHRNIIRRGIFQGFQAYRDPIVLEITPEYVNYKYSYSGMHLLDMAVLDCAMSFVDSNKQMVIKTVVEALKNPYFRTRNRAANLLVELKAKNQLPLLKEILSNERRSVVTRTLKSAIKKLEEM